MIEPNWNYFLNAPLSHGTIQYKTKTERVLVARVTAASSNWQECQTYERLERWKQAREDLEAFRQGQQQ